MANRAYLLNTRTLSNDCFALRAKAEGPERQMIEVAQAAHRIPVPWLCLFRAQDLRPFSIVGPVG